MRRKEHARVTLWRLLLFATSLLTATAGDLIYKPARIDNPLKGIIPSNYGRTRLTFPHTLHHIDFPLSALMLDSNRFDWKRLDARLEGIAREGCQSVVRVYLDWPGRDNTIPVFLHEATEVLQTNRWRPRERIPQYESPLIRSALTDFIAAFGAKYDGHPDIAFIEAGLLGAWGEWFSQGAAAPTGSPQVQQEVLKAYELAFHKTKILVRHPTSFTIERASGYHDDWFGHKNGGLNPLFTRFGFTNSNSWQQMPIGGRIHPEIQNCLSKSTNPCQLGDQYLGELQSGHFTYLRLDKQNTIQPGPTWEQPLKYSRALGYEFYVPTVDISYDSALSTLTVAITVRNTGIAPFYYKWPVEIALAREDTPQQKWNADWDIRKPLPKTEDTPYLFNERISVPAGNYQVQMRIPNPAPRGRPISFANETQDADLPGWLRLGSITIPP